MSTRALRSSRRSELVKQHGDERSRENPWHSRAATYRLGALCAYRMRVEKDRAEQAIEEELMSSTWIAHAGVHGVFGVAAGAFGAHALKTRLTPDLLEIWHTAAHYQLLHALAFGLCAWLVRAQPSGVARWAGRCFSFGVVIFSGSLYALALSGVRVFGAITPIGGAALIAGWVCVALSARQISENREA